MKSVSTKSALCESRRHLVELMQNLNFGRIEKLVVRDGNPVLTPLPRLVREVKFGGDNDPRPERDAGNFVLKAQVIELFQQLDRLGDGILEVVEVKHGLPFRMLVASPA